MLELPHAKRGFAMIPLKIRGAIPWRGAGAPGAQLDIVSSYFFVCSILDLIDYICLLTLVPFALSPPRSLSR
jgi:hypothetical protein